MKAPPEIRWLLQKPGDISIKKSQRFHPRSGTFVAIRPNVRDTLFPSFVTWHLERHITKYLGSRSCENKDTRRTKKNDRF